MIYKMVKGIKLRGSDSGLNLILIDSIFHRVSPDLVSFEMVLTKADIPNIYCIGYSKPLQQLFVQFRNGRRYIYFDVPVEKWQIRHNYEKINKFYADEIKGIGFHEVEDHVSPVTNEYVLDAYNNLEYYKVITEGLWATDQPGKVIDPDGLLFQIGS